MADGIDALILRSPDRGRIVGSGGAELVRELEAEGYGSTRIAMTV